ncbi:MAG: PTS sugar transporter subunit IIA [Gammaproteobacteria bacterium]|nr:PTS sugar transporter subunit IIA [Gammaproteobacteria bacterium]
MQLSDILAAQRVRAGAQASSKKRALELLSQLLAEPADSTQQEIFESLTARERLGSTALGYGVALPHGRMKKITGTRGAFVQLVQGVDFDAADRTPVDLLFAIVVPEQCTEEHLELVAQIAELFSNEATRTRLRQAKDTGQLLEILVHWNPQHAP